MLLGLVIVDAYLKNRPKLGIKVVISLPSRLILLYKQSHTAFMIKIIYLNSFFSHKIKASSRYIYFKTITLEIY